MMYRRHAVQQPRISHHKNAIGQSFATMAAGQVMAFLVQMGVIDRAERENRRRDRQIKRARKHSSFPYCGKLQRERFARQIAAGQKTAANGVVFA